MESSIHVGWGVIYMREEVARSFQEYVRFVHAMDTGIETDEEATFDLLRSSYKEAVDRALELNLRLHYLRESEGLDTSLSDYGYELKMLLNLESIELSLKRKEVHLRIDGCPFYSEFHSSDSRPYICPIALFIATAVNICLQKDITMKHEFDDSGVKCLMGILEV